MPPREVARRRELTRRRLLALAATVPAVACTARSAPMTVDPSLPAPSGAPLLRGRVLDVRAFGARGDGTTDDTAAVRRALDAARGGGDTVLLPAGTYRLPLRDGLVPPPGTTMAGEPGRTLLRFEPAGELAALDVAGTGVALDGLVLERSADAPTVLVRVGAADRLTLSRLVLLGHAEAFGSYCHGVQVGVAGGVSTDLALHDTVVSGCTYGFFQANESTAITVGVEVRGCTFARNTNTDLEFNSPFGSFRRIRVLGCTFRDNDSPGFAVGLAHCAEVVVRDSTMTNYRMEALHIEDWTDDVLVQANVFSACGLREFAHVQVISGTNNVRISDNRHDATMNTEAIPVVGALPGGSGLTAGGREVRAPTGVTVAGNRMSCSTAVRATAFDGVVGGSVTGNVVDGPGTATSLAALFRVSSGSRVRVAGNTVVP